MDPMPTMITTPRVEKPEPVDTGRGWRTAAMPPDAASADPMRRRRDSRMFNPRAETMSLCDARPITSRCAWMSQTTAAPRWNRPRRGCMRVSVLPSATADRGNCRRSGATSSFATPPKGAESDRRPMIEIAIVISAWRRLLPWFQAGSLSSATRPRDDETAASGGRTVIRDLGARMPGPTRQPAQITLLYRARCSRQQEERPWACSNAHESEDEGKPRRR